MLIKAKLKHLRIAPRKVRLVTGLIRGKSTEKAEAILDFTPQRSSKQLLKLLKSVIANAKNN
ncbi:MAG TPA: 50S ribosomal protein L22, partial [bacterium]|nr:50S ribosomal protein L22 [bacterium]